MKPTELAKARGDLVAFAAGMLGLLPRCDQRRWGETCLRGLMLDGRCKSIEPMAARLADGDEQCLPAVRQPESLGARAPGRCA
jgi:SRSO17 transposase